jgi:hypothetical protein
MSQSIRSHDEHVSPIQVWRNLSGDRQFQIMRLLAQLALNLVLSQPDPCSMLSEVNHASPTQHPKNQT